MTLGFPLALCCRWEAEGHYLMHTELFLSPSARCNLLFTGLAAFSAQLYFWRAGCEFQWSAAVKQALPPSHAADQMVSLAYVFIVIDGGAEKIIAGWAHVSLLSGCDFCAQVLFCTSYG